MKKILITGEDSYIGGMFTKWVAQWPDDYEVHEISVRGDEWKQVDFSSYDSVFHVAGIAHVSSDPKMEDLYFQVNRDLTIDVAKKAKADNVKQFVFMSSIIVYGTQNEFIDENTKPNPDNFYGESKIQAEEGIRPLQDENFNVAIIRPPMIYGKGSKGNYPLLSKLAQLTPIFPDYDNQRSMLHIDNLTEFIRLIIDNTDSGIFFPQNEEYVKTSDMVKIISNIHNKRLFQTKFFNLIIRLMTKINLVNKVFGDLSYDKKLSNYKVNYNLITLNDSINRTELGTKMRKSDILIVTDNNLETVGGEQESTKIILENLKNSFNLAVFQPGPLKNKPEKLKAFISTKKTRVKYLVRNPFLFIKHIYLLNKAINSIDPKIIHTQAQISFFLVAFLKKTKIINQNIKLVHTERGLYKKYNKFIKNVFLSFINELDTLVTTTQYNRIDWQQAIEEKDIEIHYKIIPNTAGELFEIYDETKEKDDKDTFIIGFSGRYTDWKNWPLAIEIIEKLNCLIGNRLEVKIAVGVLDQKAELETKKMFKNLNNKLGNRFEGKINITLEEMSLFYYKLDLFILTSKPNTESFGRTLVEAMSRKTAVLTTNAGGSGEVVGNPNNICYSLKDFMKRITFFIRNPEQLDMEKNANYLRVKENYSLNYNINKHLVLYEEIEKRSFQIEQ